MNLEEFMNIVENVCSDIFLFVLIFLYENRPFTKTTLLNYQLAKSRIAHLSKSPHLITINKKIASPSLNSKFSPCIAISKSPVMTKKILGLDHSFTNKAKNDLLKKLGKKSDQIDGDSKNILLKYLPRAKTGEVNSNLITQLTDNPINSIKESEKENVADNFKNIPVIRKNRHNLKNFDNLGTTQYFCITDKTDSDMLITPAVKYKSEGRVKYSTKELDELIAQVNIKEENESESNEVKYEGYLFKITNTRKLKRLWFKLLHKDLYCKLRLYLFKHISFILDYKNSEETIHKGMHNISGVFVNEENTVLYDTLRLYCFSVIYPKKSRFYYTDSEEEYKQWIDALRKATGYKNLTEIYDIGEKLGNGKFGLVRLGIHKETGRKVAVKIMNKTQMNELDLDLVKTEIEILKICQHPNIIRLYDIFENINYIYIIMEYCAGGDLFSYIENRGFRLPELRTAQIIHKLCAAVYYLHSYGIAHRDLKPENILMTDNTDTADIKLVDFGLSKIIGPNEYCNEPFGTLSYVAPEVLLEKPYTKAVDMWSIGVITYLLLSGSLPFDHQTSDKEIARQTIYDPVRFPFQIWRKNSLEARAFIESKYPINKPYYFYYLDLLQKDPARRMTITQVLEHSWFQKYNMNELRLKSKDFGGSTFKFYTTVEESVKTS